MAASSLRRWPTEATPSPLRSSAVSSGRTSASTSLSRNACSYWPKPSPRSQAPTSTPVPPIGRARPHGRSLSRAGPCDTADGPATAAEGALVLSGSSPIAGKAVRVAFDGGRLTSDAGVLRAGGHRAPARDRRAPGALPRRTRGRRSGCTTPLAEMIRFRVLLIAAGYPDANDCDALRADPAFKMALGRAPESGRGPVLAADHVPAREPAHRHRAQADDGGHGRAVLRQLRARCRAGSCSTSTTPRTGSTAARSSRSSTPTTTGAASCRSTSTRRSRASRWR